MVPILFGPARGSSRGGGRPEGDGPLVLVVGRLAPNKRHDLVLAAFERLRAPRRARRAAAVRRRAAVAAPTRALIDELGRRRGDVRRGPVARPT